RNSPSVAPLLRRGSGCGSSSGRASAFAADLNNPLIVSRIVWACLFLLGPAESLSAGLGLVSPDALPFPVARTFAVPRLDVEFVLHALLVLCEILPVVCCLGFLHHSDNRAGFGQFVVGASRKLALHRAQFGFATAEET